MPTTKVIKPKPVEATRKTCEKAKPVKVKAVESELRAAAVRKGRASSCPRCPQRDRGYRTGAQGTNSKTICEGRVRSISAAPKPPERVDHRASCTVKHAGAKTTDCPVQKDQRSTRPSDTKYASLTDFNLVVSLTGAESIITPIDFIFLYLNYELFVTLQMQILFFVF